jgi:hypothetical protein
LVSPQSTLQPPSTGQPHHPEAGRFASGIKKRKLPRTGTRCHEVLHLCEGPKEMQAD